MKARVDAAAAERFLAVRYGPVSDVLELRGGEWSVAYAFRHADRDLVARFGLHIEDYVKDQKAMAFAGPDLPVPRIVEIGEGLGGYYAISERHFGVMLEELDAHALRQVLPALLRTLDAMRELPPSDAVDWASGEPGRLSWTEWLSDSLQDRPERRTSGWLPAIEAVPEVARVFEAGQSEMRSLYGSCPDLRHVLHRDLINRNVLVRADASRIEAVLDWQCSLAGDFLYEIAWITFWSDWHPVFEEVSFLDAVVHHYADIGLEVPHLYDRLRCYQLHIALESISYNTFMNRPAAREAVVRRTREVLDDGLNYTLPWRMPR